MTAVTTAEVSESPPAPVGDALEARLEQFLGSRGKLSATDLGRARRLSRDSGDPVPRLLVRLGLVSERDMAEAYAQTLALPLIPGDRYPQEPLFEGRLSVRFMKDVHAIPVADQEDQVLVALADPLDPQVSQALTMACGKPVTLGIGLPAEIDAALERLYGTGRSAMGQVTDGMQNDNASEEDIEHLRDLASEDRVIRLVNLLLQRAVESRASDIHIEPFQEALKIRYRVDGVLREVEAPPASSTAAVISRVKILARLNIAERRLPQDGRIPLRVQGKELDLRVSTIPTLYGESVVLRLLDKESVRFDFDALGFQGSPRERLLHALDMPHGIVLVTGPTGSGKSTTLYTALSRLNTAERKIITVEDPVEYQLTGINQVHVKPSIGMTFASALRAIVRQDPDVIMVGEMRDLETARIAVQSALTGHLVLSTLHTNNAAGGVTRLLDMGVEDYLMTSTVNGILAQRLVRRLCHHCRVPYPAPPDLLERLAMTAGAAETLYHPGGCEQCGGSGYYGRLVIAEMLEMSEQIRRDVMRHAGTLEIQRTAMAEGMITMYSDGLTKAAQGWTTLEEVIGATEEI
ncbi:Type II secretion system protein E [Gammaproteobacteria bacterium]